MKEGVVMQGGLYSVARRRGGGISFHVHDGLRCQTSVSRQASLGLPSYLTPTYSIRPHHLVATTFARQQTWPNNPTLGPVSEHFHGYRAETSTLHQDQKPWSALCNESWVLDTVNDDPFKKPMTMRHRAAPVMPSLWPEEPEPEVAGAEEA